MNKQEMKFEFCTHEQHGGVCKLTGEYCSLGPCPNEDIEEFAPVRHGRWEEADWIEPDDRGFELIRTPKAAWRCSECRNCFKKELLWKNNYCPHCGAIMDGAE